MAEASDGLGAAVGPVPVVGLGLVFVLGAKVALGVRFEVRLGAEVAPGVTCGLEPRLVLDVGPGVGLGVAEAQPSIRSIAAAAPATRPA